MQKKLFFMMCMATGMSTVYPVEQHADSFDSFFDTFESLMNEQRNLFQKTFDQMHESWNSHMNKFQKDQMRLKITDEDAQVVVTVEDICLSDADKELPVSADVVYADKDEAEQVKITVGTSKIKIRYQDSFLDASVNMSLAHSISDGSIDQENEKSKAKKNKSSSMMHFSTRKATTIIGALDLEKVQVEADYKNNKIVIVLPKIETTKNHKKVTVKSVR